MDLSYEFIFKFKRKFRSSEQNESKSKRHKETPIAAQNDCQTYILVDRLAKISAGEKGDLQNDGEVNPLTYYEYTPFSNTGHVRLLCIQAGEYDDPLRAGLVAVALNRHPPYEALSYVWGTDKPLYDLLVDGKLVKIRRTAFDALRRLRVRGSLVIWIDAVCINQQDLEERAQQVSMMRHIYENADEVFFYLGEFREDECRDIERILEALYKVACRVFQEKSGPKYSWVGDTDGYEECNVPDFMDACWASFVRLLEHPWFNRVWVIQESVAARNGVYSSGIVSYLNESSTILLKESINSQPFRAASTASQNGTDLRSIGTSFDAVSRLNFDRATFS